jgi:peptide/nickel transport system permease protein
MHLILPALSLSLPEIAILSRPLFGARHLARTMCARRAPRASTSATLLPTLRNARSIILSPVLLAGFLLAGAIIVETVFYLPGVGKLVFDSINNRDLIVIKNVVMLLTALVLVVNLIVDVIYVALDPRPKVSA